MFLFGFGDFPGSGNRKSCFPYNMACLGSPAGVILYSPNSVYTDGVLTVLIKGPWLLRQSGQAAGQRSLRKFTVLGDPTIKIP